MAAYDVYSRFYDATQGPVLAHAYRGLLQKYHPKASSLLEIACGTGAVLGALAADYESVAGLDVSKAMLRVARKNYPDIRFHNHDMRDFRLSRTFDAIICPYDSINHLRKFSDWKKTFKAVRRHLNPNGLFIFDANTQYGLDEKIGAAPQALEFDGGTFVLDVVDAGRGAAEFRLKIFEQERGAKYRLHAESITEVAFSRDRIRAALNKNFRRVHCFDAQAGWSRPNNRSRKLYWVCLA